MLLFKRGQTDYQTILAVLSQRYGWSCDPGAIDNRDGPATQSGVKGFQAQFNGKIQSHYPGSAELAVDGVMGPQTWGAIFTVMRGLLTRAWDAKHPGAPLPALTYGYNGKGLYPCGESFPVEAAEKDGYISKANRRVELVFYDKNKAPEILDPPSQSEPIPKEKCEVYDPAVMEKKPIEIIETEPPVIPDEEGPMVFYAPGLNEYFVVEPADIDALATEVKELESFAGEIKTFRESFKGKKADKNMTESARALQKKASEKFKGLTDEPSKAIQELLLVKSNKRWGSLNSRVYIRPYKVNEKQVRGHWRKHNDKTVQKLLQDYLKQVGKKKPEQKKKIESKLKYTLFESEKIDTQWPWKWKFKNEGSVDTAAGYFSGSHDVQFFRFVAGAKGGFDFDLNDKKLNLGVDSGISYGIVDGSIKGHWGLPDQDGFDLYRHLILTPKAREAIKSGYECRFRFGVSAEGKVFTGASLAAAVSLPSLDFGAKLSVKSGGNIGFFAGGSVEGQLSFEAEWSKRKTEKFDKLAAIAGTAAAHAGIGAEGKFEFEYKEGKVRLVVGAMLTYGIGSKAGLAFEIGVDEAIELFSHVFRSLDWHKVDSVTLMAFEFYTNVAFAQFIAAGKVGAYIFEKSKEFWGWIEDHKKHREMLKEAKENIRKNINNIENLKKSPPEAMGRLILTLMATPEPEDFDAIIKILKTAESTHELKWVLRNAQDKFKISADSSKTEKGNALDEGIKRLLDFGQDFGGYSKYKKRVMDILYEANISIR